MSTPGIPVWTSTKGLPVNKDLNELVLEPCALVWDDGVVQVLEGSPHLTGISGSKEWTITWDVVATRPGWIIAIVIGDRVSVQTVHPGWGNEFHITQRVVIK